MHNASIAALLGRFSPHVRNATVRKHLGTNPRPLLLAEAKAAVVFSPRAACSSVVVWFLTQVGLAEEARAHGRLPHKFRKQVYYKSASYQETLRRGDLADFGIVRVMRDPFARAVSSFRHLIKNGYANEDLAAALGRHPGESGLSFAEFLGFLEQSDLTACNPHFRLQRHPIEETLPVRHLINVSTEDLFTRLNEVEADLGLPRTDFAALHWLHQLESERKAPLRIDGADAFHERLTWEAATQGPWPRPEALLVPEARERLARLYAEDIRAYGVPSGNAKAR